MSNYIIRHTRANVFIDFKIACLIFKCIHNLAPPTLSNAITSKSFNRNTRAATRANRELQVPVTKKKTFASRAFSVYGPELWNTLPNYLRSISEFKSFKKGLKTFLFERAFKITPE